eukprot:gene1101-1196_t
MINPIGDDYNNNNNNSNNKDENDVTLLLDESEQNQIIEELKTTASFQSSTTRQLFAVLFATIAVIFLVCLAHSLYEPWKMEHQKHFKEILPHWIFLGYYFVSAFCFLISAVVVLDRQVTLIVRISRYLAVAIAVFVTIGWIQVFYAHGVSNPLLFWIPVVNLAGLGLAQYVHLDSKSLLSMADDMQHYKYSFKTA